MQWLIQDFAREGSESSGQEGMGCETRLYRLPKHFSLLLEIVYYGEFSMVFFKLAESALPMGNRTVESALSIKFLRRASRNMPHFQGCGLNIGLDDVDFSSLGVDGFALGSRPRLTTRTKEDHPLPA